LRQNRERKKLEKKKKLGEERRNFQQKGKSKGKEGGKSPQKPLKKSN